MDDDWGDPQDYGNPHHVTGGNGESPTHGGWGHSSMNGGFPAVCLAGGYLETINFMFSGCYMLDMFVCLLKWYLLTRYSPQTNKLGHLNIITILRKRIVEEIG